MLWLEAQHGNTDAGTRRPQVRTHRSQKEDASLPLLYKEFYLLSFQVAPSFVSFTSNP